MYQIVLTCTSHTDLGSSDILVLEVNFPFEFMYLLDYLRKAIDVEMVPKEDKKFVVTFTKLTWSEEQDLILKIKLLLLEIENREAKHQPGNIRVDTNQDSAENYSDTQSQITRVGDVDYNEIQLQLAKHAAEGLDLEALRAKI